MHARGAITCVAGPSQPSSPLQHMASIHYHRRGDGGISQRRPWKPAKKNGKKW
ncbi:hypothetical protein [Kitasatospora purpeofusca]|uniref:hypothetical protein n=1 Tax=Kitasatospora purpeofusca TaxID=67352 RepID=UPI0036D37540